MPVIDYFFTSASPFTYLGHEEIRSVAGRHNAKLNARPCDVRELWAGAGTTPFSKRSALAQSYMTVDIQRIAERRGLPINPKPKFFPVDPAFADLCTLALIAADINPMEFMDKVFGGVWARDENIADKVQIAAYLTELGHDAEAIIAAAEAPDMAIARKANSDAAVAAHLPGVPGYVIGGEPFFGQDRIDDLEHALDSGRPAFRPQ